MNAPFKQRENIEMFLKGCEKYGLQAQDLFQVCTNYFALGTYMFGVYVHTYYVHIISNEIPTYCRNCSKSISK